MIAITVIRIRTATVTIIEIIMATTELRLKRAKVETVIIVMMSQLEQEKKNHRCYDFLTNLAMEILKMIIMMVTIMNSSVTVWLYNLIAS